MEIRDLYASELGDEFEGIKNFDLESEEHKRVVGDITQLTDRFAKLREIDIKEQELENERKKIEADKEKTEIEKQKFEFEKQKNEEDRKHKIIGYIIDGLGIALPAAITATGMVLMFLFEEKGTITSKAGGKIVDRMFRK